jgi:hypothetical protein
VSYATEVLVDSPIAYLRLGEARDFTLGFACGFECSSIGYDWVAYGSGTAAFDTTIAGRSGARACKIPIANSTATNWIVNWPGGSSDTASVRIRFRLSALPTSDTSLFAFNGTVDHNAYVIVGTDGTLAFANGGTTVYGPMIVANEWHTLQFAADGANKVAHWSVDGVAQTDPGAPANVEQYSMLYIGKWNAVATGAFDLYADDVVFSFAFADYPIPDGVIAGPPAADERWSIAVDASGHGAYGTYVNSPTLGVAGLTDGDADTAVAFTRASAHKVNIEDGIMPAGGSGGAAIEAWFKFGTTVVGDNYGIFSWGVQDGLGYQELDIYRYDASGTLIYWYFADATDNRMGFVYLPNSAILDGVTYHIVGSHDYATNVFTAYLNGVSVGTPKNFAADGYGTPLAVPAGVYSCIAGYAGNDISAFNGTLDEVAVYDHTLSPTRVAAHYAKGAPAVIPGITMARYRMVRA